jgi:putative transposase
MESLMNRLDYWNTLEPAWGIKTLVPLLRDEGFRVSPDTVRELRQEMGLETIYPKENTSKSSKNARKMPYLLGYLRRNDMIWLPNLVWAVDLTYIKMARSHMYLIAIIDWFSRFIVGWELADTLETAPVLDCVKTAIEKYGIPAILNSDQGSQFTSDGYMSYLWKQGIRQSMDGKGRWIDNVIIERWFRSLKIENIYINEYITPRELGLGITDYIYRYNYIRPHQSLHDKTPYRIYDSCFNR